MLFSAFLFALSAVPALSAPMYRAAGGLATLWPASDYPARSGSWQSPKVWLEGLDRMQKFEGNALVGPSPKMSVRLKAAQFTTGLKSVLDPDDSGLDQDDSGKIYWNDDITAVSGPEDEELAKGQPRILWDRYKTAVDKYGAQESRSGLDRLGMRQQQIWTAMERAEWTALTSKAARYPGDPVIGAAIQKFINAGDDALRAQQISMNPDLSWKDASAKIISEMYSFKVGDFRKLDAIKVQLSDAITREE